MLKLGKTVKHVRARLGLTQREAAEAIGITNVMLSQIENNHAGVSWAVNDRFRELWDVDLYVLAWCLHGDMKKLPKAVRAPAAALAKAWMKELGAFAPAK